MEDGEKIIDTAINNYGKVDIVINNAGILRDKSFVNMADADWDKVFQVKVFPVIAIPKFTLFCEYYGNKLQNINSIQIINFISFAINFDRSECALQLNFFDIWEFFLYFAILLTIICELS